MPEDKVTELYRAGVIVGKGKDPVGLTGGSMTKSEAEERAAQEAKEYKKLGIKVEGVIVPDTHPARWPKNQNVGH